MDKIFVSKNIILAGLMTALTAVGAFIKIPFLLVPMTMQTFFSSVAGLILSPCYAGLSQFAYVLLGLLGFPVFAQGGGIGYIFQPTFGYLLSLPVAASSLSFFVSKFSPQPKFPLYLLCSFFVNVMILFIGTCWLYINVNYYIGVHLSLKDAIFSGILLMIPGTLLKIIFASYLALVIRKRFFTLSSTSNPGSVS